MLKTLISIFKNKKLRTQLMYTLLFLLVFRLGASLTVPGVTVQQQIDSNSLFGIMNLLGGGGLKQFSLFALGVSPYITASIVVNLLALDVIPSWHEHTKSGDAGKKALAVITKRTTLLLSILQGFALTRGMSNQGLISFESGASFAYIMLLLVSGSMITLFLGDKISDKGIGNGLSIIIFSGIVAAMPYQIWQTFQIFVNGDSAQALFTGLLNFSFYMAAWYFLVSFMVYIDQAERKIPIQYSVAHDIKRKEEVSYLPLKVNISGVIPLIFASSMILAPSVIASFFPDKIWAQTIMRYFNFNNPWAYGAYMLMIFGFTYFQAFSSINPEELTSSLSKSSSFIPGIRTGQETKEYITRVLMRISAFGGLFLMFVAAMPKISTLILKVNTPLLMGGSSMIIVAGVSLETYRQIQGQLFQASYKGFDGGVDSQASINKKLESGEW